MYSRKSVRSRMEPWETPALTGYSCEDFQYTTTQNHLLKDEIRSNIQAEISKDLCLLRRSVCQILSKASDISSTKAQASLEMLKALSNTKVRRSAADRENLKPYWKSEKRSHFSKWSTILLFTNFSQTLLTTERRLTGQLFLAADLPQHF